MYPQLQRIAARPRSKSTQALHATATLEGPSTPAPYRATPIETWKALDSSEICFKLYICLYIIHGITVYVLSVNLFLDISISFSFIHIASRDAE